MAQPRGREAACCNGTGTAAGTKLTYQWMRNGTVIMGAACSTYKVTAADKGKTMTVKITGSKTGHTPASAVSKKTAAVR